MKLGIGKPFIFYFLAYLSRHRVELLYVELLCYGAAVLALCRRIRVRPTRRHLCLQSSGRRPQEGAWGVPEQPRAPHGAASVNPINNES